MNKKVLMTGNEAIAKAAISAGCDFYAGYPITPQNELIAFMAANMSACGRVFVQAESEISAISMVMGAAACGRRAMTSSSSPGISLKQEGISYLAGARLGALIVNIMRGGPGLGNIAPAQSDYFQAVKGGGHGDYHSIVLAPSSVQEAYDLVFTGFDLADKYRTPVILLGDGMIGQMMEEVFVVRRSSFVPIGQESRITKKWALTGCKDRKPNVVKSFFMQDGQLEIFNNELQRVYQKIKEKEQNFEEMYLDDAEIILTAYGSMARVARAVVKRLRQQGKKAGLLRPITLWPFPLAAFEKILNEKKSKKRFFVLEMSYGQMLEDVCLAVNGRAKVDFYGRAGGGVPTVEEVLKFVIRHS